MAQIIPLKSRVRSYWIFRNDHSNHKSHCNVEAYILLIKPDEKED